MPPGPWPSVDGHRALTLGIQSSAAAAITFTLDAGDKGDVGRVGVREARARINDATARWIPERDGCGLVVVQV